MSIALPRPFHNTTPEVAMFCKGCGDECNGDFCNEECYADYKGIELPEQEEWNTEELKRDFEVLGFQAPYVVVRRKSDRQLGSLEFVHQPRLYFSWMPHEDDGDADA